MCRRRNCADINAVTDSDVLSSVREWVKVHQADSLHAEQVAFLSLRLFDDLAFLHGLGSTERVQLNCAALLHDIGCAHGRKGHHKASRDLILRAGELPFDERERVMVACVARYHRKALPNDNHKNYERLNRTDRRIVQVLSAILRVADGLDSSHHGNIEDVHCDVTPARISVRVRLGSPADMDFRRAREKGILLEEVFERRLVLAVDGIKTPDSGKGPADG